MIVPSFGEVRNNPTLAVSLETWLGTVQSYGNDILSTHYGIIFGKLNLSSYDVLAQKLLNEQNWQQIVYLKRVCEIANYNSRVLQNALLQALENIPMLGAIPQTFVFMEIPWFLVSHRYMINAYRYAEQLNLTFRWNKQLAFEQFAKFADRSGGGFLMCNTDMAIGAVSKLGDIDQNQQRYYDEQAQCLEIFSMLGDMGVIGAKDYALRIWNHLNNDGWFDQRGWYWYRPTWQVWECEMGGFAMIISRYLNYTPESVLNDLNWKLLRNGWNSGCWTDNVIVHAYDYIDNHTENTERRPLETNTVWHTLHSVYPELTSDMKGNMTSILLGNSDTNPAWFLSMGSGWFNDSDTKKLNGAMVMFLTGIIPVTGSLDLGLIEEGGSENIASYSSANLRFDHLDHRIRIPVKRGELKFLFGAEPVTWNFVNDGTFDVRFSDDWNVITGVKAVSSNSEVYNVADINRDGTVDPYDASDLSTMFSSKIGDANWNQRADLKQNGIIDILDAIILAAHYGKSWA